MPMWMHRPDLRRAGNVSILVSLRATSTYSIYGTPTARAKLVNAERGTGGALLNGFSCESGSNAGVWDKIVTPARRS